MAEPVLKLEKFKEAEKTDETPVLKERIKNTFTAELIIGLCGPIGTDIHFVAEELKSLLESDYGYTCHIIRLSSIIRDKGAVSENTNSSYEKLSTLINVGNELRKNNGGGVLAELAISEIAANREKLMLEGDSHSFKSHRVCYIIDSIKNTDELDLFRLIYSQLFYFIGVFSNLQLRAKNLEKKGLKKEEIYELFDRDSGEELQFGQKVSDSFLQADFFLRLEQTNRTVIKNKLSRFLNLVFNSEVVTPNSDETAMYQAFAAAGNSACLSRQVGASITDVNGKIISVGWNDVPKFGGGVYKSSKEDPLGENDQRCINFDGGKCLNDEEKRIIGDMLVNDLANAGLIDANKKVLVTEIIKKSRLKELIEFSRAVHAEMHALIEGSQKSANGVAGGKLYCTTYPCHNCARHIVAAGITEVYYIEPYRKSLATKLHYDSITEDESDLNKLRILIFDGVSPKRYLELFKMNGSVRKKDGKKIVLDKRHIEPKITLSLQAIPILEKEVIKELKTKKLIEI